MRLTTETEPGARAGTLRAIAEVLDAKLQRAADAEAALLRAIAEQPEAADLHADIERLAAASDGWARYADALGERAQSTFDVTLAKDLYTRLGRVAETQPQGREARRAGVPRAVEQVGDQPELLEALDRLYARLGDPRALADVLERRVAIVDERRGAGRPPLSARGDLHHGVQGAEPRALGSLRAALERTRITRRRSRSSKALTDERDLFEEVADVLEGVYRSRGKTEPPGRAVREARRSRGVAGRTHRHAPESGARPRRGGARTRPPPSACCSKASRMTRRTARCSTRSSDSRPSPATGKVRPRRFATRSTRSPTSCPTLRGISACAWRSGTETAPRTTKAAEKALEKALEFDPNSDEVLVQIEALQARRRSRARSDCRRCVVAPSCSSTTTRASSSYRRAKELADQLGRSRARRVRASRAPREGRREQLGALRAHAPCERRPGTPRKCSRSSSVASSCAEDDASGVSSVTARRSIARDRLSDAAQGRSSSTRSCSRTSRATSKRRSALRKLYEASASTEDLARLLERLVDVATTPVGSRHAANGARASLPPTRAAPIETGRRSPARRARGRADARGGGHRARRALRSAQNGTKIWRTS